jgi:hypothetical protein
MLASLFGGRGEQQLDDLLGAWLCLVKTKGRANGVRGRRQCLEEVWTHLWLITNRCENRRGVFPMSVPMFGGVW